MAVDTARELGATLNMKWDANGLATAIAVDADTGQVLMVAFMNQAALDKTLETGRATYWSRSRQKFWIKGEESGHTQEVQALYVDCDQDAIVMHVRQHGAACHNGFRTCFYRQIVPGGAGQWELKTVQQRAVDPTSVYKK